MGKFSKMFCGKSPFKIPPSTQNNKKPINTLIEGVKERDWDKIKGVYKDYKSHRETQDENIIKFNVGDNPVSNLLTPGGFIGKIGKGIKAYKAGKYLKNKFIKNKKTNGS